MSRLAPGRTHDMKMLLGRREKAEKHTPEWNKVQLKIDDLIEEGRCGFICKHRERLLGAARAGDTKEIEKISELIDEHVKYQHRKRHLRQWLKKG